MLSLEVRALLTLATQPMNTRELAEALGSSYRRTAEVTKKLMQNGFTKKTEDAISIADTVHAAFFAKLARRYDMLRLLSNSAEDVVKSLLEVDNIRGLERKTGLTYWTVRRVLNRMMETGAVREQDGRYTLSENDLVTFLQSWILYDKKRLVEPYAEVVYSSQDTLLKKVPHGRPAEGSPTAFSMFAKYGVELRTIYDYYAQPERQLTLEDILIHAIIFSENPTERTDCAVLLAKNLKTVDFRSLREASRRLGVEMQLLDLENYVKNMPISSSDSFLPWSEFAEKARLYGVEPRSLLPPEAYPDFFRLLGETLSAETDLYLFGGEAMRIRALKRATKDVDAVVEDERAFQLVGNTLKSMGYRPLRGREITETDRKLRTSAILTKEDYPRVDLFVRQICGAFLLSNTMKARVDTREFGELKVHILSNEDLFLLKSITDREGDVYDMLTLAKAPGFDWHTVIQELYQQEELTGRHFCRHLLDSIETIEDRARVRSPIRNMLINHCIDQAILESVERWGAVSLKQIKELVNYPDYRLRSRITRLIKQGRLIATEGTYRTR